VVRGTGLGAQLLGCSGSYPYSPSPGSRQNAGVGGSRLTRFLGDSVENLNKSQLKMGIWGGKREGAGPPTPGPPGRPVTATGSGGGGSAPAPPRPLPASLPTRDRRSVKRLPRKGKEMAFLTHLRQHLTAGRTWLPLLKGLGGTGREDILKSTEVALFFSQFHSMRMDEGVTFGCWLPLFLVAVLD
jgi:hypothetical protein